MLLEQLLEENLCIIKREIRINTEICRLDAFQACIFISEIFISLKGVYTNETNEYLKDIISQYQIYY